MLLTQLLNQLVRTGSLSVIDGRGRTHVFGDNSKPRAAIRLHRRWLDYSLAVNPPLRLGEAYMDGTLTIEEGALGDFLEILARNYDRIRTHPLFRAIDWMELMLRRYNTVPAARRHVAHHYDLSDRLYELFLDPDRQYSCAYFPTGRESLEEAQTKKKHHIAAKLFLNRPGLRILDVGSGWGGLALHLARIAESEVVGITLSEEQHATATRRALQEGLAASVRFEMKDYREIRGTFDRIVSVGMFEHVGRAYYRTFFRRMKDLLAKDGVALLHTIGWPDAPVPINPFIRKYIFPGAELPSLSELLAVIERSGLFVTDVEILRQHYAHTLRHWIQLFERNRHEIQALYDERFCRMWEFYLAGCETFFRHGMMVVYQIQLAKSVNHLPMTRDYMYAPRIAETHIVPTTGPTRLVH